MARIEVLIAWSQGPRHTACHRLQVEEGSTIADALNAAVAAGFLLAVPGTEQRVGIYGKLRARDTALRAQDRIEIYRPLKVDPKEARRQRARKKLQKT